MGMLAESGLHLVEAFTPPPDCSVSVAEARRTWTDKVLWVNFPASVLVGSERQIRQVTEEVLEQAGDRSGFLMGITEDVPAAHLVRTLSIVLDVMNERTGGSRARLK
jgi:uroporphyrinogen-III decarboxylase